MLTSNADTIIMRTMATLAMLALPSCSMYRDQAEGAANIRIMAAMVPSAEDEYDRAVLARGIDAEAESIHRTLDPDASPTIPYGASAEASSAEAVRHAGTMRTPVAQAWDMWGSPLVQMGLGAAGLGSLGGVVGAVAAAIRKRRKTTAEREGT